MGLKHLRNYSILHAHGFRDDLRKRNYVLGDPDSTTAQITIWRVAVIEIIEHSRTACRGQKVPYELGSASFFSASNRVFTVDAYVSTYSCPESRRISYMISSVIERKRKRSSGTFS